VWTAHMQAHHTASRLGSAWATNCVASTRKPAASNRSTASATCVQSCTACAASAGSATRARTVSRLAPAILTRGCDISVDHRDGALERQHRVAAYLRHKALDLRLHLALDLDHHAADG